MGDHLDKDYSRHKVLIVDDEIEILKALKRGLYKESYSTYFASSGKQALEYFEEEGSFSVIITDMRMPGMTGLELLKSVDEISPNTVKIVLTGYTQLPQILTTVNTVDIFKFITKPWDLESELKVYIKEALDQYESLTDASTHVVTVEKKNYLYNKMLVDSYEKVDYLFRLYEELIKAINQHHLFTVQALKDVDDVSELGQVIHLMNDRVHYLNKVFEMSRYTLKLFDMQEFKESLERKLDKIGAHSIKVKTNLKDPTTIYHDNYKMFLNMLVDLMELIQFNGPGIDAVEMACYETKSIDVDLLQVKIHSRLTKKLEETLSNHYRFVEMIVQIVGGKLKRTEEAGQIIVELDLQVIKKSEKIDTTIGS